jgi:hypothetical protein
LGEREVDQRLAQEVLDFLLVLGDEGQQFLVIHGDAARIDMLIVKESKGHKPP